MSLCSTIASLHFSKLETNTFFSVTNNSSHMKATVGLAMSISCGGASVCCFPRAENCWRLTHRCLCSAAAELTAGNAVRMREFPSQHKEAPVCCGSADNERSAACVCAVLILEAAVDALSHKNDSSETWKGSRRGSHRPLSERLFGHCVAKNKAVASVLFSNTFYDVSTPHRKNKQMCTHLFRGT